MTVSNPTVEAKRACAEIVDDPAYRRRLLTARFLINTPTGDPAIVPITVVLNWTAGLK